ncbi:MAG TPA: hypothetical protein VMA09_16690 [Candidatus Binataceae bacterium]|nr:hypothetical protein [Candidatus Binataceae bacterium]
MTATIIQPKPSAVFTLRANLTESFSTLRIASMDTQEKAIAIRGLGAIKQETIGLQLAREAMLDELPGLAIAVVTLVYLLSLLSGLL